VSYRRAYKTKKAVAVEAENPTLLDCPSCNHFIGSHEVHMEKGIAKCTNCDHVFSFEEFVEEDPIGTVSGAGQSEGVEILRLKSLLEIRVNHYKARGTSLGMPIFFTLLWNVMLLPFIFSIVASGQWHILLFISLHLFAGISMLRSTLSSIFNRTTIDVTEKGIRIVTKPFGKWGAADQFYDRANIKGFSVGRSGKNFKTSGTSALIMHLSNGKKVHILNGIDKTLLQKLDGEIENYLGISN